MPESITLGKSLAFFSPLMICSAISTEISPIALAFCATSPAAVPAITRSVPSAMPSKPMTMMSGRLARSSTVAAPTAIRSEEQNTRLRSGWAVRIASSPSTAPGVDQWPLIEATSSMPGYLAISSWKPLVRSCAVSDAVSPSSWATLPL